MKVTISRFTRESELVLRIVAETEADRVVLANFVGPKPESFSEARVSMSVENNTADCSADQLGPASVGFALIRSAGASG